MAVENIPGVSGRQGQGFQVADVSIANPSPLTNEQSTDEPGGTTP